MKKPTTSQRLLRTTLLANATFSGLSGVILVSSSGSLSDALGIPAAWLFGTGIGLLLFSLGLVREAARPLVDRARARVFVAMDAAWVAGSALLLAIPPDGLTTVGWWAIAGVAEVVLLFAILQGVGLRRSRPAVDSSSGRPVVTRG